MSNHTSHVDTFILDHMPERQHWPDMDYSVLPELAAYPARLNVARELIDRQVSVGSGKKPAVLFNGETWSYADLLYRANQIAAVLTENYGLIPGETSFAAFSKPSHVDCVLARCPQGWWKSRWQPCRFSRSAN